jgi:benzoyl-CoA reductase subunit C
MRKAKPKVGWACSMVPEELIFAAGLEPVRIIGVPAKSGFSADYFPANFCSLVKSYLDIILDQQGAKWDGLIITPACNATEFLFDAVKQEGVVDFLYMLDAPRKRDQAGVEFFAGQLRRLADYLADAFGTRITRESLLESVILFNSIRENLQVVKRARLQGLVSGQQFFNLAALTATGDKRRALQAIIEVGESVAGGRGDYHGKKRILLTGTPLLNAGLIDCVESAGGLVCGDDLCTSQTYLGHPVDTEGDLFINLARSYLQGRICSRMESKRDRIDQVRELLEWYHPDGVIYNLSKFRVADCYDSIALKEELFAEEVPPFLVIENENGGPMDLAATTRIETFMELLQQR